MRSRRGFTLAELMTVVAIIGIISALAAASITAASRLGKVNGAATSLAALLTSTRTRAITEHCAYVLQINGPTYTAGAAPLDVPRNPNTALMWRKNTCSSAVGAYEPGLAVANRDRLVEEVGLRDFGVGLTFPVAVVAGGTLGAGSVSIGWSSTGVRTVYADDNADGTSADMAFGGTLNVTVTPPGNNGNTRIISIPVGGSSKAL